MEGARGRWLPTFSLPSYLVPSGEKGNKCWFGILAGKGVFGRVYLGVGQESDGFLKKRRWRVSQSRYYPVLLPSPSLFPFPSLPTAVQKVRVAKKMD